MAWGTPEKSFPGDVGALGKATSRPEECRVLPCTRQTQSEREGLSARALSLQAG